MKLMPSKPEKANADRMRRYYEQHERELARGRDYYETHKDTTKAYDPAVAKARYEAWKARNPDALWVQWLRAAHGMRPDQWYAMWEAQDGLCYLGNHPLPDSRNKTVIDHDHRCCLNGRSCKFCRRGLACSNCNSAIGMLNEDPALLRKVAENLERAHTRTAALIATKPVQQSLIA